MAFPRQPRRPVREIGYAKFPGASFLSKPGIRLPKSRRSDTECARKVRKTSRAVYHALTANQGIHDALAYRDFCSSISRNPRRPIWPRNKIVDWKLRLNEAIEKPNSRIVVKRAVIAVVCLAALKISSTYQLGPVLGKDFAAITKVFGVKFKQTIAESPDMQKGKSYTKAEEAALPKIKLIGLEAAVPDLGQVHLMRSERDKAVTYFMVEFSKGKTSSWKDAFSLLGLAIADVKEEPIGQLATEITFKRNGKIWHAEYLANGLPGGKTGAPQFFIQLGGN